MRTRRIAFALAVPAALAATVEATARALLAPDDVILSAANAIYRDHPTLFWTLRPNLGPGDGLTTNADGFRGPALRDPEPDGAIRVLALGESSTMGANVGDDAPYARQLERLLGPPWEVVNAGVGAWTVWQSHAFLSERVDALDPEVVVLYHQHNDFLPTGVVDRNNYLWQVDTTDRELWARRRRVAPVLSVLLHSRAYLWLRKQVLLGNREKLPVLHEESGGTGVRVPREDRRVALEGIRATCAARGIALVVVRPTYARRFDEDTLLADFAGAHGLPYVDLPALRDTAGIGDAGFFTDGIHPSPTGHGFIARALLPVVRAAGEAAVARSAP